MASQFYTSLGQLEQDPNKPDKIIYNPIGSSLDQAAQAAGYGSAAAARAAGYSLVDAPAPGQQQNAMQQNKTNQTNQEIGTPSKDYSGLLPGLTPERSAYEAELLRQQQIAQGLATGEIDEAAIRAETEKRFQAEIDALNQVYAEKKRQLGVEGQGRIGSSTAIQARRGLIGSDFGAAQTEGVNQYNREIIAAADAEQALKIAGVRQKISAAAQEEVAAKRAAKEAGAAAYLEFLKGASERKQTQINEAVASMLESGMEDEEAFDYAAKTLKADKATIKTAYNKAKKAAEAAAEEAALKGQFNLSEGQTRYDAEGNKIASNIKPEKPEIQSIGGSLVKYDPSTGKTTVLYTAPKEKDTEKPITEVIDNVLYQYDSTNNTWKPVATAKDSQSAGQVKQANDLISLVDTIKKLPGLDSSVGPAGTGWFTRTGYLDTPTGAKANFIGQVQQLVDNLTLAKLIEVKGQGATFGALSDSERKAIERAATPINQWVIRNKDGDVVGYKIDQASFDRELNRIKTEYENKKNSLSTPLNQSQEDPLGIISSSEPFNQVGNTSASTSYLKNYGPVTGPDGSPYWKWGLDVDLRKGDPVYTPVSGVVVQASDKGDGFGNRVGVKTPQGNIVYLAHLDGVNVKVGQTVTTNQLVGKGGNTGKTIATGGGDGSHLDITVKKPDGSYYTAREIMAKLS